MFIADQLSRKDLKKSQKILFCLFCLSSEASTTEIRNYAIEAGLRIAKKWNISAILRALEEQTLVSKHAGVWQVRSNGIQLLSKHIEISHIVSKEKETVSSAAAKSIEEQIELVNNKDYKSFLEEVLVSINAGAYRASVIMIWVGSLDHLQNFALNNGAVLDT